MNSLPFTKLKYRHSILLIDDEQAILDIMTMMLADEGYDLYTANSAEEGLKILKENPIFSLIISDQMMPGMTGVQFFTQAREICPNALRILLTGYTNTEAIIDAINSGGIHLYITKPWQKSELPQPLRSSCCNAQKDLSDTPTNGSWKQIPGLPRHLKQLPQVLKLESLLIF